MNVNKVARLFNQSFSVYPLPLFSLFIVINLFNVDSNIVIEYIVSVHR